jgi:hypothetical protein
MIDQDLEISTAPAWVRTETWCLEELSWSTCTLFVPAPLWTSTA